jgi:hypothetical protein
VIANEGSRSLDERGGLDAVAQPEFCEDAAEVALHRLDAYIDSSCDLSVREPLRAQYENLTLSFRESVGLAGPGEVLVRGVDSYADVRRRRYSASSSRLSHGARS